MVNLRGQALESMLAPQCKYLLTFSRPSSSYVSLVYSNLCWASILSAALKSLVQGFLLIRLDYWAWSIQCVLITSHHSTPNFSLEMIALNVSCLMPFSTGKLPFMSNAHLRETLGDQTTIPFFLNFGI